MKYARKQNGSGRSGGFAAFAVCSVFLLLGAAAGSFAGSYADGSGVVLSETGRGFGECLALNLLAVGAVMLLGSSCVGFILLPLLCAASGFAAAFAMSAVMLVRGSWSAAFLSCGWVIALALPLFTVLCAFAMQASAAALGLLAFGTRPRPDAASGFIKLLIISAVGAVLLAALQAA